MSQSARSRDAIDTRSRHAELARGRCDVVVVAAQGRERSAPLDLLELVGDGPLCEVVVEALGHRAELVSEELEEDLLVYGTTVAITIDAYDADGRADPNRHADLEAPRHGNF